MILFLTPNAKRKGGIRLIEVESGFITSPIYILIATFRY